MGKIKLILDDNMWVRINFVANLINWPVMKESAQMIIIF